MDSCSSVALQKRFVTCLEVEMHDQHPMRPAQKACRSCAIFLFNDGFQARCTSTPSASNWMASAKLQVASVKTSRYDISGSSRFSDVSICQCICVQDTRCFDQPPQKHK